MLFRSALHKIGAIVIPATNQLVQHDFTYRFKAAGVKAIVCTGDGDVAHQVDLAEEELGISLIKMMAHGEREGWADFDKEMSGFSDVFDRPTDPEKLSCGSEPNLMFFTSGTTGYPKIATHSHKYALGHFITARYWHNVDPNGLHFTISDTGWGKALWGKLYGQWLSETCVFVYDFDRFDAHKILPMFKKYNITTFCAPPTMYRFFIKEDLSKYDLSSIKYATVAGEALNPEVYNQFLKATGVKLMEHSWWQNSFVNAFSEFLYNEPSRVAWVGDYADEPDDFNFPNCSAFYVPYYGEVWGDSVSAIGVSSSDFTLDNKFLLNHDTNQFVDLDAYKAACTDKHGWCIHPLPLLTAVGNDRGSGDFHAGNIGFEFVGLWAWQLISFADSPPSDFLKINIRFIETR